MTQASTMLRAAVLAAAALATSTVAAQTAGNASSAADPKALPAAPAALTEADVRKVDAEGGKITLRHAPIPSLDMPAMTMVFRIRDPALLATVKAGDKVRFAAEKAQGAYWVTALERAP
ncbi:MAG TPA: copper-binding protein [Caldimonas sp.]|jgi:Cu/Ag efflux protein CusF|nr:copper-binding protein [Caldimonas sp.]HEX2543172.1 copper-binding protein [Caldimonas sp.]